VKYYRRECQSQRHKESKQETKMGCCLDLLELRQYQMVMKVKSQHRTKNFGDKIRCCQCNEIIEHEFLKKNLLGFAVRINCPGCGWKFEG
jgi:hypothetical protein